MARIRSIKPEIRRSLTVCSWTYPIRWTFAGLPGYCDDEGRALDDVRLIKAELYPLDDDMTSRKIEQHLIAIATNGPLCRYEVGGQKYLHLTSFAEHQRVNRPTPSRLPPCPVHDASGSTHAGLTEASSPRAQARVPAEQGREGKGARKGAGSGEASRSPQRVSPAHDDADPQTPALQHSTRSLALLDEHTPWVTSVRGQLVPIVDELLAANVPDTAIRAGIGAWRTGRFAPAYLANLVQDALRPTPSTTGNANGSGPKSRAAETLALADRLDQMGA